MLMSRRHQQGSFMIEALIGIVIFLMGVLAMIALQASSIAIQTDAQYRNEASNLVDQILGEINLGARDPNGAVVAGTLTGFAHNPAGGTTTCRLLATDANANTDCCNFGGGVTSINPLVTNWVAAVSTDAATRLPASDSTRQQIVVNAGAANQVIVTVCWQGPKDARPRFHRVIGYVN
jgi:type IV pilus assembly protein PilV